MFDIPKVKEVEDPSAFGVVITEGDRITKFEEKPLVPKSSLINAGIYILSREILNLIPKRNTSIEKEIFPKLAEDGILHFYKLNAFWADIGKPAEFLRGQEMYLEDLKRREHESDAINECSYSFYNLQYSINEEKKDSVISKNGKDNNLFVSFDNKEECKAFNTSQKNSFDNVLGKTNIKGNVMISSKAVIKKNCILGNNVVIGENVVIEEGCRIRNSCIMNNTKISAYSYIENSIIGSKSIVGSWSRIEGLSVLGEGVVLSPELFLNNVYILPFKEVKNSIYEKGSIIM